MEICGYTSIEFVIDEQFNDIDTALEAQYNKVKLEDNKFRVNTVEMIEKKVKIKYNDHKIKK